MNFIFFVFKGKKFFEFVFILLFKIKFLRKINVNISCLIFNIFLWLFDRDITVFIKGFREGVSSLVIFFFRFVEGWGDGKVLLYFLVC